ncbi:DUF4174 domain-containing protein [Lichenicola sp.]|uniref:DUF4174 domain-containing protein n=1 Tax=Lichenicola sp. TaxID=2804529 RepID=UPI003B00869D
MRMNLGSGMMALGLLAAPAVAQSPHRLVIVVGHANDPRVSEQHAGLEHDAAALRERDVVIQDVTPEAARRDRPDLGTDPDSSFEVLLVGKDGQVKLRRDTPVAAREITALIDTMPMRRAEMRR